MPSRITDDQNACLWEAVKEDIELKIITGVFNPNTKLPHIRQIAEDYQVGANTVQRVIEALSDEGTVFKKRGVGIFVMPFVKDKLRDAHKRKVEKRIRNDLDYASRLGLDPSDLVSVLTAYIENKSDTQ